MLKTILVRVSCVSQGRFLSSNSSSSTGTAPASTEKHVFETRIKVPLEGSHEGSEAAISVIHMADHKARNALSKASVQQMLDILHRLQLEQVENSQQIRALILKSDVPGVFCAGANLKERQQMSKTQVEAWLRVQRSLMDTLSEFPYPTIAAIDGHALGGGLELALACDMRVVNEEAKVGLVETRLAIIPGAGGTQRLARVIGVSRAKEHIFVAEPVSGSVAAELGIANSLARGENGSYERALLLATKIAQRGPRALRLAKLAIDSGSQQSLDTGLDFEQACYGQLLDSSDRVEGMRAFLEKRRPLYKGD